MEKAIWSPESFISLSPVAWCLDERDPNAGTRLVRLVVLAEELDKMSLLIWGTISIGLSHYMWKLDLRSILVLKKYHRTPA